MNKNILIIISEIWALPKTRVLDIVQNIYNCVVTNDLHHFNSSKITLTQMNILKWWQIKLVKN